jgi:hypothetical protein
MAPRILRKQARQVEIEVVVKQASHRTRRQLRGASRMWTRLPRYEGRGIRYHGGRWHEYLRAEGIAEELTFV